MLVITLIFLASQSVLAVGQMTKPIDIQDVLRGQEVTDTLILFNSKDQEITYELIAEGEIKDWASFYEVEDRDLENPITRIQVPAESSMNATVKFKVPEDTPNSTYSGSITIMSVPDEDKEETEGTSATVRLQVSREVSITVTDQEIIEFETAIITQKYNLKQGEPLQIKVIHKNQGNVSIKPDVKFKILKDEQTVFNVIFPYPENEAAIKPRTEKTLAPIEWQTIGQKDGDYRAEIEVLLNDQVYKKQDFRFNIGSSGKVIGASSVKIIWPILGAALIIVFVLVLLIVKKRLATAKNN